MVSEVRGEDFEWCSVLDGEPVKFLTDRSDVFSQVSVSKKMDSRVLNVLEVFFGEFFGW